VFARALTFTTFGLAVALAAGTASAAPPSREGAQAREGRVYLSVTGSDGKVLPLSPADITISEDGRAREVLRVEKATGPLEIALLVDDSQAAQNAIHDTRTGLRQFVDKVLTANPDSQLALITFGERPVLLSDYTNSRVQLEKAISRIFARQGSGAYMLEAIVNAARGAAKRNAERAHIIIVGTEGIEFSNDHYERVLDQLAESGATLWALTLTAGQRAEITEEVRNRNVVLGRGTAASGGRQELVLANSAVPHNLERLADTLFNQYVVTYGRPDALVPPKRIDVKVTKPGARVLAPETAPRVRKQ